MNAVSSTPGRVLWIVSAAAASATVLGVALFLRTDAEEALPHLLIALQILIAGGVAVRDLLRPQPDLFHPRTAFSFFFLLGYPLAAAAMLSHGSVLIDVRAPLRHDMTDLMTQALLISTGGILGFYAGFALLPVRMRRADPVVWDPGRMKALCLGLAAVGAGLFSILVWKIGGWGAMTEAVSDRIRAFEGLNYLASAPLLFASVVVLLHALRLKRPESIGRGPLWILTVLTFGFLLANGAKTFPLIFLLAVLCLLHYGRRKIRLRTAGLALIGFFALCVVYDTIFREYIILGYLLPDPFNRGRSSYAEMVVFDRLLAGTVDVMPTLVLALDVTPGILPFQLGGTYQCLLFSPVPRVLYPDKPTSPAGIFTGACAPDYLAEGSSIPPSLMGEFYLNFSWPGVLIGMVLVGMAWKWMWGYLSRSPSCPLRLSVFAVTFAHMFPWLRGESMGPTISYLILLLPILALSRLAAARRGGG